MATKTAEVLRSGTPVPRMFCETESGNITQMWGFVEDACYILKQRIRDCDEGQGTWCVYVT